MWGKLAAVFGLMVALVLALAGLVAPLRFGSVPEVLLQEAVHHGQSPAERAAVFLRREQTGPATLFIQTAGELHDAVPALRLERDALLAKHPRYLWSGGPSVFFDAFWDMLPTPPQGEVPTVAALLASSPNRKQLSAFLERSGDPVVRALLSTRTLTGWERFFPVDTPGGAALDSTVLTSALLAQSGAFREDVLEELESLPRRAAAGDAQALATLERIYLSILSASGHFNWLTLQSWVEACPSVSALVRIAPHLRRAENPALLYACVVLSGEGGRVAQYLDTYPDDGMADLTHGLAAGSAGLHLLLEDLRPLSKSPRWTQHLPKPPPEVVAWFYGHPRLGQSAVILCWLLAGWFLAVSGKVFLWGQTRVHERRLVEFSQDAVMAVCLLLFLLVASEPSLLNQPVTEPGKLFLEFELKPQTANVLEQPMDLSSIDQITLLVLLLFFAVQLIIYVGCLVKLSQVKRAPVSAAVKLKLLENEDSLFDTGLYVGLAGTVISLLMLALGVVQASLVAAYASTLFGIIFVALLKILHVRPIRQKLILEAERSGY